MKEEKTKTTKKRNLVEVSRLLIGLLIVVVIGTTYAMIVYENDLTSNSSLVAGDIYMYYNETNQLTLENAMPSEGPDESKYFEFTISGKNTYKQKDIWYEIQLNNGDKHETRTTRIRDYLLRFKLVEIKDNQETVVVDNQNYASLTNRRIYVNTISKDTTDEVNITYRLYMWIDNNTVIGNTTDADYDIDTWNNNIYGSVKVAVKGDFEEKTVNNREVVIGNFVETVKAKYGTDSTLVAVNTDGDLYDSSNQDQEIREYRYSGPTANNYVYFDTNGDGVKDTNEIWRVVGVFKDTLKDEDGNVVNDSQGNPTYEEEVKLVRNTMLTADELPESYLINGTTYTIADSTTSSYAYWNSTKVGTNYNDWTTAGLQYYLNTEEDETDTSEGATANAGYLSLLTSEAKEIISPTTYHLGNVDYNVSTVKLSYEQERDTSRKWTDNEESWDGLIGMMYPSDYGYSASNTYWETDMNGWKSAEEDGVKASSTSWMQAMPGHTSSSEWFLSPSSDSPYCAMRWYYSGYVYYINVHTISYGVRPVLNLKSQAKVIDGAGTFEDPFVIVTE